MHKFSEFATDDEHLEGDKVSFKDIIDKQIIIWKYIQMRSQFQSDYCAMIQFSYEEKGVKYVAFSSSEVILTQLEKYKEQMPFEATIQQRKSGKHYYYIIT